MEGRVIKSTGSWYTVKIKDDEIINCRIRGKFRLDDLKTTNPVAVGDIVTVEKEDDPSTGVIIDIHKRKNYIIRQSPKKLSYKHIVAANIDQAMLIITFSQPRTSLGFINRFLLVAQAYHIPACLVFNKIDIYTKKEEAKQKEAIEIYKKTGYPSYSVSALTGENISALEAVMKNKITLISGHSGVGKSSLLNSMHPVLDLKTDEVSKMTGKGKHATTFAEMLGLPFGGSIIDTPGIKEFGIVELMAEEVSQYFPEMRTLLGQCRFKDCLHVNEPGCVIKEGLEKNTIHISRYKSYLSIIDELQNLNSWEIK